MTDTIEVSTTSGMIRGERTTLPEVSVFRGIPFAAPPVGDLRFRPPMPVPHWDGVRDAREFGPIAVQPTNGFQGALSAAFGAAEGAVSEDCLTLNVWTPEADNGRRPVMVWIHGGAFRMGSGSSPIYDGTSLATRGDAVVVTLNYRLGLLGFLASPELGTANCGLLDQIAALEWVRDNIATFGGDPSQVTVFGESAGAKSVECLLAMPAASGLFSRAILQSTYDTTMDLDAAATRARAIAGELGGDDLERLRTAPIEELLAAEQRVIAAAGTPAIGAGGSGPVVDGTTLPCTPLDAVRDGAAAEIPIIVGTTLDESRLFAAMARNDSGPGSDFEAGARLLSLMGAPDAGEEVAVSAVEAYRAGRSERGRDATPTDLATDAMTDRMFRQHSIRLAEAAASHQATYTYLLTWESPVMGGRLGSCHAIDLPFVFGTIAAMSVFVGEGPEADALAATMQDAWLSFASDGAPAAANLPSWPAFDISRRATMILGPDGRVADAPLDAIRRVWADHSPLFAHPVPTFDR